MSFMDKSSGDEHTIGGPELTGPAAAHLNQIQARLLMGWVGTLDAQDRHRHSGAGTKRANPESRDSGFTLRVPRNDSYGIDRRPLPSPKPSAAAALAFHHLVALLKQALAFAVLALRLLLDVGASFIGHDNLPAVISLHSHEGRILGYKQGLFDKAYSK
jgi:hypothetical protein